MEAKNVKSTKKVLKINGNGNHNASEDVQEPFGNFSVSHWFEQWQENWKKQISANQEKSQENPLLSNNWLGEQFGKWQTWWQELATSVAEDTAEQVQKNIGDFLLNADLQKPLISAADTVLEMSQHLLDFKEFMDYATIALNKKPEWATPNVVVGKLRCFDLRQFSPEIDKTKSATLVLPPFAGHYSTIADFSEKQSLVKHLMDYGIPNVYSLDYHSATKEMQYYNIDDYLAQLDVFIDDIGDNVNLIGLCQGGWFGSIYTARFPQKVRTLVVAGSPIDTKAGDGHLENTVDDANPTFFKNLVKMGQGVMDGKLMVQGFKNMNPMQHYVEKYQKLYKMVKGAQNDEAGLERYENFEIWYENTINLPGKWYEQVIDELFRNNHFVTDEFVALGRLVSPKNIKCPMYLLAGDKDDITLPEQVFDAEKYIGTPKDKIGKGLAQAGHIGLFMGRSVLGKNWKEIAEWILKNQQSK